MKFSITLGVLVTAATFASSVGATVGCSSKGWATCYYEGNRCTAKDPKGTCPECTCFVAIGSFGVTAVDMPCVAVQLGLVVPKAICGWHDKRDGSNTNSGDINAGAPITQLEDGQPEVSITVSATVPVTFVTVTTCTTSVTLDHTSITKFSAIPVIAVASTTSIIQSYGVLPTYGIAESSATLEVLISSIGQPVTVSLILASHSTAVVQSVPTPVVYDSTTSNFQSVSTVVPTFTYEPSTTSSGSVTVFQSITTPLYASVASSTTPTENTATSTEATETVSELFSSASPTTSAANTTYRSPTITSATLTPSATPSGDACLHSIGIDVVALAVAMGFAFL